MKQFFVFIFVVWSCAVFGQAKPNQFTEETNPNNTNFELYSQKNGLSRRAQLDNIKKYMDQSLLLVGDSLVITRTAGRTGVSLAGFRAAASSTTGGFAVKSSGLSYSLPSDTLTKYSRAFILYEAISTPAGSTITLPTITAAQVGKFVDIYFYFSAAAGDGSTVSTGTIQGDLTKTVGTVVTNTTFLTVTTGAYRFVATSQIGGSGRRWLLVGTPQTGTSTSFVNSVVARNVTTTYTSSTFINKDVIHFYCFANTGNAVLSLPQPDSTLLGKTVYFYPYRTGSFTTTVSTSGSYLASITGAASFTTTSSIALTYPTKFTVVSHPTGGSGIYWEYQSIDNNPTNELQTLSYARDTLKISQGNAVYVPRADSVLLSRLQWVNTNTILGRYSAGSGIVQQIGISSDFKLTGGVLALNSSAANGYSIVQNNFASGGTVIFSYFGSVGPTLSGGNGAYTFTIPSGCKILSFTINGTAADLRPAGDMQITVAWTGLPGSINTAKAYAFPPAFTIYENATSLTTQLNAQGTGYQITNPTISGGSTISIITGLSGIGTYIIRGTF